MHALALSLALSLAATTPGAATEALKARDAEIRKALPPPDHKLTAKEKLRLEDLLTAAVDLPAMAQAALGKRFEKLTEADRKRYIKAFSARFKKASEGEIDFYRGTEITYGAEAPGDGADVTVPTTLTIKGEPTPVMYTVRQEGSGHKIVDLSVDGVSTVENYRASFGKIFDKEGAEGLVSRLAREPAQAQQ